jgi:Domain of unknown function (DUF4440)/Domain of unknown function (DUF3471)
MRTLKSSALIVIGSSLVCIFLIPITNAHERADIRGVVTHISRSAGQTKILGRILIEGTKESDTRVDKASVTVTTETTFFVERDGERKPATFADLKEGQRVEASFIGPVMESYPVQAAAGEITILSSAQDKVLLKKTWSGKDIPNEVQNALPPDSYVADKESWTKLWRALRGTESLPRIDFAKELIVFCTTNSPNSCAIDLSMDEQGDLKITSVSTLIGSDAKTFNYQIASIDRGGIKSIAGKALPTGRAQSQPDSEIVAQLKQTTQELLDAIAPGNKSVWEGYLATGSIYADEEGRVLTRDQLLAELNPLPKGYVGSIKIGETKALVQDNVVVLSHRDREELELYNQKIVTNYHMTNTWARQRDGQWQLVSTQVMAVPSERKPATIDPRSLDAYIGQYELAPDVTYLITREGDKLFGQRTGRPKDELLPLCVDVFYRKGVWRGEKVFERDAHGQVVKMLDRRENNDLVWKRVNPATQAQQAKAARCTAPEYRQFDFWLGDWDTFEVDSPDKVVARNRVSSILDGCALLEVYEQRGGLNGQSFTIYDATRKVWHQSWVTNRGQLLLIEGGLQSDRMVLTGIERGADGKSRLIRGIWKRVEDGVRETAETSSDDGKTWKPFFDIVFRPHKP